jgi:chromosome segregation ATPase
MSTEAEFNARIDRLTERHEALAQSLGLLAASVQEGRDEATEIRASIAELHQIAILHELRLDDIRGQSERVGKSEPGP